MEGREEINWDARGLSEQESRAVVNRLGESGDTESSSPGLACKCIKGSLDQLRCRGPMYEAVGCGQALESRYGVLQTHDQVPASAACSESSGVRATLSSHSLPSPAGLIRTTVSNGAHRTSPSSPDLGSALSELIFAPAPLVDANQPSYTELLAQSRDSISDSAGHVCLEKKQEAGEDRMSQVPCHEVLILVALPVPTVTRHGQTLGQRSLILAGDEQPKCAQSADGIGDSGNPQAYESSTPPCPAQARGKHCSICSL